MVVEDRAVFDAAFGQLLEVRWYAVVNDLIGGWSVINVDKRR